VDKAKKLLAMCEKKLGTFLKTAKLLLHNPAYEKRVHVVLGNQASDADSIISALCHAYFEHAKSPSADVSYIPVASIPRSDIHFRREVQLLLQMIDLSLDDLICLEEVPMQQLLDSGNLEISLTDHNVLDTKLHDVFATSVKCIIDHHSDGDEYPWVSNASRNIAFDSGKAQVGSACTLIAENFLHLSDDDAQVLDGELATLLLAVITLE
jgi:exopolyphosphatase